MLPWDAALVFSTNSCDAESRSCAGWDLSLTHMRYLCSSCVMQLYRLVLRRHVLLHCRLQRTDGSVCCATGPKMADFRALLSAEMPESIVELTKDVEDFAKQFPTVGFEKATMRYTD